MRIRAIKPEFWRSDDITALSREFRLLFVGLWSYVDDNGVGVDDYRQIAADLFALEEDQKEVREYVREGLATLSRALLVIRYEVAGKPYLFIRSWDRHQRIDRPSKPRYPRPPADTPPPTSGNNRPADHVDGPSRDPRDSLDAGTGEQGNRGTEEKDSSARVDDVTTDRAHANRPRAEQPTREQLNAATTPGSWSIITAWRDGHTARHVPATYRAMRIEVDKLLAGGAVPDLIAEALREWDTREKAGPGLLPHLYGDAVKRRNGGTTDGRHLRAVPGAVAPARDDRPIDEIPDDEIDVEDVLGPDGWMPHEPDEVYRLPREERQQWFRDQFAERKVARVAEARRVMADRRIRRAQHEAEQATRGSA